MKTLKELRNFDYDVTNVGSYVKYLKTLKIDWDVYLPRYNYTLQRPLVWTLEQKRDLIWSILLERNIPHLALIGCVDLNDTQSDIYKIIDGKQRLSTIFKFIDDEFTLNVEGGVYFFSELPNEYRLAITNYYCRYYLINEPWGKPISDKDMVTWFTFINYKGTQQDTLHLDTLNNFIINDI